MGHQVSSSAEQALLRQPHEINLRLDNVVTAVEAAHDDAPAAGREADDRGAGR